MLSKNHRLSLILLVTCVVISLLAIGSYKLTMQLFRDPGKSITIRKGSKSFREMPAEIREFPVIKIVGNPEYSTRNTCTCGATVPPSYCINYFSSASERELQSALNPIKEQVQKGLPDQLHSFDLWIKPVPPDDTAHSGLVEVTARYMTGPQA